MIEIRGHPQFYLPGKVFQVVSYNTPLWRGLNATQLLKTIHSWFYQCHARICSKKKGRRVWRHASASVFKVSKKKLPCSKAMKFYIADIASTCSNGLTQVTAVLFPRWPRD